MDSTNIPLTEQQQAIVAHDQGPALVFAVAGAGKTTALTYRIARLVGEEVFAPQQILATTFNRSAADELKERLRQWEGCNRVDVRTLHALGLEVIRVAFRQGYLPDLKAQAFDNIGRAEEAILNGAMAVARQREVSYKEDLNHLDRQDFLNYVGACKGQLAYADLNRAALPEDVLHIASQAQPPPKSLDWYLPFYQLYEIVRQRQGLITYNDMLMTGWEVLVRHEDILAQLQHRYQSVLVDEFQDVNLAQSEMLDLITQPHRNYMAIGDDDQTIYEWRGADARFILHFERRYGATVYFMTENFRCKAGQIVLANRVIQHNKTRRAKRLQLTQGFHGETAVYSHPTPEQMGQSVVAKLQALIQAGYKLTDVVVLVRVYAQTPPIEQALITADIPYEVVGDAPFYARPEVQTLIDYCRLAWLERLLVEGKPLSARQMEQFGASWRQVYWRPKRYITREMGEQIARYVTATQTPLGQTLRLFANEARPSTADKMHELADDLSWLAQALPEGRNAKRSAAEILHQLEQRLDYKEYLEENSGFFENGLARAETVEAFIDYARGRGDLQTFLQHVQQLSRQQVEAEQPEEKEQEKLVLTTIYRAKGLEWPVVFVPHCNQDVIPHKLSANVEEERRLLYVAITRAQEQLYLHWLQDKPLSQFLTEADYHQSLKATSLITRAMQKVPSQWGAGDVVAMGTYTRHLHLHTYFEQWWSLTQGQKQQAAELITRFYLAVEKRNLFGPMGLKPEYADLWQAMLNGKGDLTPLEMAELDQIFQSVEPTPPKRKSRRSCSKSKVTKTNDDSIVTQWQRGDRVRHPQFGVGQVLDVYISQLGDEVQVAFGKRWGIKCLLMRDANLSEIKRQT